MTLACMAVSYRHSAGLLRQRIRELEAAREAAEAGEQAALDRRIRDLRILCRETVETARVLENYYSRGKGGRRHGRR